MTLMAGAAPISVVAEAFTRFFGSYEGGAISATDGELEKRDLRVSIASVDGDFSVNYVVAPTKIRGKAWICPGLVGRLVRF